MVSPKTHTCGAETYKMEEEAREVKTGRQVPPGMDRQTKSGVVYKAFYFRGA